MIPFADEIERAPVSILRKPLTGFDAVAEAGLRMRWYSAFDSRDVAGLYPLDAHNFAIEPPIENQVSVDTFTDNRHGISGYLSDRDVARKIDEALRA